MKSIATFASLAAYAAAITLGSEGEVAATTSAGQGWDAPIVPESFDQAVHEFDLAHPITDQECYQKQVDIYSDQIIAIEALRLEVLNLTQRITAAEHDFEYNAIGIAENKAKITANSNEALLTKAKIEVLYYDMQDVAACLGRQWHEQETLRHVLELYCHQFTYVAHLPYQCEAILASGHALHPVYAWH